MTVCLADVADTFLAVLFLAGALAAYILLVIRAYRARQKVAERLADAQDDYADALDRLTQKPGAIARRKALARGRELMAVIEEAKEMKLNPPHVSEVTIQNDLQAATGS